MKSHTCVAVLALLLVSVAASKSDDHKRLIEALLRYGAEHVGPKMLPALKHSRVGDIKAVSGDIVIVDKYSYVLQSGTQRVNGVLSNLTLSGLSSMKLRSNGKSVAAALDLTIQGQYSLSGTSDGAVLEGQGGISIQMTDLESEASLDYTAIDETKISINSIDLKVSTPSTKITFENFIVDTGATKFLKDLLEH